jgi:hypothetical protein
MGTFIKIQADLRLSKVYKFYFRYFSISYILKEVQRRMYVFKQCNVCSVDYFVNSTFLKYMSM